METVRRQFQPHDRRARGVVLADEGLRGLLRSALA
jgi:hypothetical protein